MTKVSHCPVVPLYSSSLFQYLTISGILSESATPGGNYEDLVRDLLSLSAHHSTLPDIVAAGLHFSWDISLAPAYLFHRSSYKRLMIHVRALNRSLQELAEQAPESQAPESQASESNHAHSHIEATIISFIKFKVMLRTSGVS